MLINDTKPGEDNSKISWYPEPHYRFVRICKESSKEMTGTFRSPECLRCADVGTFKNDMCSVCEGVPKLPSFKKRLLLRSERIGSDGKRNNSTIRNDFLSTFEMQQKLKEQKEKLDYKESQLFFLKSKNLRLRMRKRSLDEKLAEFARRGSMKAICHNLDKAAQNGYLKDRNTLVGVLQTVARNFHVEKNGRRYQSSFKLFLEVLLLWGGPRVATFVAINLCGPEIHSIYRWRNQHLVHLDGGFEENNFKVLGKLYKEAMSNLGVKHVPVLAAEDETAILGQISYSERTDELLGFCGVTGADHKCLDYFTVVNAFNEYKIGPFARAIILNPLHPKLPRIPVLIMLTCNRFDHEFVFRQWQTVERLYEKELQDIVGPLIGHSSDGDSRRRKLMLQLGTNNVGSRYRAIPMELGFVLSCRKVETENGYIIRDACDQDYIHNHKKLLNPLDHASRVLMLGDYLVHMNHLQLVYEMFPIPDHGLGLNDIQRSDRQNWRSAQKLTFPQVRNCLQMLMEGLVEGHPRNPSLLGTMIYLHVVWLYVEIFCSSVASLRRRITYAAIVTHFLAIWHNYIHRSEGLSLKQNFITRETYQDIVISCQFAVILICYMRDNFPEQECCLELSGSDVLEDFWSKNGQWVGNHHNYSFGDLRRNASHMIRLEEIRINPDATDFAKPHPKQESIWHRQYEDGYEKANLNDYPVAGSEVDAWKEGMYEARRLARSVGMAPDNDASGSEGDSSDDDDDHDNDSGGGDNSWFYRPFQYPGNRFGDLQDGTQSSVRSSGDEEDVTAGGQCFSG